MRRKLRVEPGSITPANSSGRALKPQESGLLGPVVIVPAKEISLSKP